MVKITRKIIHISESVKGRGLEVNSDKLISTLSLKCVESLCSFPYDVIRKQVGSGQCQVAFLVSDRPAKLRSLTPLPVACVTVNTGLGSRSKLSDYVRDGPFLCTYIKNPNNVRI